MNCCGSPNDHAHDHQSQGSEKHRQSGHRHSRMLMMAICFGIPIAVIAGLLVTGGVSGSGNWLILAAVLICPLMHLLLMPGMMKKESRHH
ncbi:MAG: DUF2933 domain-containing protein [Sporolactobacillus sp.]|jgi:uncharacterized membrane protein YtjA (UPF0391 family)|nr:DUF2933 domain-containing protein [Sporolactobacillus sp.]